MNAEKGERTVPQAARVFRTIGEVAADLGIPKHVLRFWEGKFPRVRPMKRGGRRRYYRLEDVDLLRGIHVLLRENRYTIEGVQKILREQGVAYVKRCGAKPAERPTKPWRGRRRELAHILAELEAGRAALARDPMAEHPSAGER